MTPNKNMHELDHATLYHGDCRRWLRQMQGGCADLVVTDPPYLVDYKDKDGRSIANDKAGDSQVLRAFHDIERVMKKDAYCVSFYGWKRLHHFLDHWKCAGLRPVGHLVFVKDYASKIGITEARHESAFILAKVGQEPRKPSKPLPDVLPFFYSGNRIHPTEKDPRTLAPVIEALSNEGDVVLDPFMGSGSTLAAAHELFRYGIGMELDDDFFAAAKWRIKNLENMV